MSERGGGYLSGNMLVAFPLKDGQSLSWDGVSDSETFQTALNRCFVDAGVHLKHESVDDGGWPSIGGFSVNGTTLYFELRACGDTVPLSVSGSTNVKFPIVSGSASWGSYVIVMSSEGISDFCRISPPALVFSRSSPMGMEGCYLELCAKCVTLSPAVLSSIRVFNGYDHLDDGPHFTLTGDVVLKPGNNMSLAEGEDGGIELVAEPGAGLGSVACVCDESDTSSGNALMAGPDGNVRIFNDTCYDLEPNTTTGMILMHVKCTSCCTCAMYESIGNEKLVNIAKTVRKARSTLQKLYKEYESAVKKFNSMMTHPSLSEISMTLAGVPMGSKIGSDTTGNKDVKGSMERCVFTATIQNSSYFSVNVKIVSVSGSDEVIEASVAWSDSSGSPKSKTVDSKSSISGTTYAIEPGRSLAITFISVKNKLVGKVNTNEGYTGVVSVDVSWSKGKLGSISKSVKA